jgi:transcriptional regulator with XRE-family HTH domain
MTMDPSVTPLSGRALEEYGAERIRNEAFDQVRLLWERRKREGWTQALIAEAIERDPGWVSRNLSAPGNWTIRTIGALTQALNGEVEIRIVALEDPVDMPKNYDAYTDYDAHEGEEYHIFDISSSARTKEYPIISLPTIEIPITA